MAKELWESNCDNLARDIIQQAKSRDFHAHSYQDIMGMYALLYTQPGEEPLKRIQGIIANEQLEPENAKDHATRRHLEEVQRIIAAMLETQ